MYDAIVVGARCAGAPVAMLLARRGHRVLLVDRAVFPSEIPHGHFVHRHGPPRLHQWGLLVRVAASCPPITTQTMDYGDFPLTGHDLIVNGIALGYAPRRALLDDILVAGAVQAGAELREAWVVEDFVSDGGRVMGVRGRHRDSSRSVAEHARMVVGADGRNSRLAAYVRAATYEYHAPITFWYFSYWQDVPGAGLEMNLRDGHIIFAFPTSDGLFAVFAGWRRDHFTRVRRNIEREFTAVLETAPAFAARVRSGRRVDRFLGATDVPNFMRQPCGPGWALVGDAGCHKDPLLALGICDAFRDAQCLASAIDAGLSGIAPMTTALDAYARDRDAASIADYRANLEAAKLDPPTPEILRIRADLRQDPLATREFYLARQGLTEPGPGPSLA